MNRYHYYAVLCLVRINCIAHVTAIDLQESIWIPVVSINKRSCDKRVYTSEMLRNEVELLSIL